MMEFRVGVMVRGAGVAQRAGGVEEPVEGSAQLGGLRFVAGVGQIALDVVDGARQDVEVVVQLLERGLGDDELAVAQLELAPPLTGHPLPLPAARGAELARSAPAARAPAAPSGTTGIVAPIPS